MTEHPNAPKPEPPARPQGEGPQRDKSVLDLPAWRILLYAALAIVVLLLLEKTGILGV